MTTFIIVDASHLFHRARHVTQGDAYTRAGMALHIIFRAVKKVWRKFHGDHLVFCLDGGSWRTAIHREYKAHRKVARLHMTPREIEDDEVFRAIYDDLTRFLTEQTRCTVLRASSVEGDDFIARWVQRHPDANHVIVSSDSDLVQLLASNVAIYDGINDHTLSSDGVRNADGALLEFSIKSDSKLKIGKPKSDFVPEPLWWERCLFTKIVRGDSSDNIFSAYPKVRAAKLQEAYDDREQKGFLWNNLMQQTWSDHNGATHRVLDRFRFNESLIDLTKQPAEVVAAMDAAIDAAIGERLATQVGIRFLRFCSKHTLVNLAKEADDHAAYLNAPYKLETSLAH